MKKLYFVFVIIIVSMMLVVNVYAQICPASPGSNLVTNGTFQSGCTGFGSDYSFNGTCNGGSITFGQWTVTNNANARNGFFSNPTGASPTGEPVGAANQYLVLDADGVLGKDAWNNSVNVIAGTTYFFSAWVSNINTAYDNPSVLRFSINGVQIGTNITASSTTHDWEQFYTTWTAPATATVAIRLENLITTGIGNDVAIDAISFSTSCSNIPNLNSLGQSSVMPDTVYNCNVDFPFALDPGLPGSYAKGWKLAPGAPISTAATYNVPPTPANGTKYYLCYEFIPGCPRTDSVLFRVTPITTNLGSDVILCAPINYTLNSSVTSSSASITWSLNGVPIPAATSSSYTAFSAGTYRVDITRPGCTAGTDQMVITSPTSTMSGSGTVCTTNSTANFSVTGSTQVKWYTVASGGTALNPGNSNPTIALTPGTTNTTTPGCTHGLYAEDISSYPGTLIPATSVATAPCASTTNYNGNSDVLIEITQSMVLNSVDYFQNSGWGNGTFTFSIFNNSPTAGPWCGSCTPAGNRDGVTGGAIYTQTTGTLTAPGSGSLQRTLTLATPQTLAPGRYWFRLSASSTAMGRFNCDPTLAAGSNLWQTPYTDNTGNNVARAIAGLIGGNIGGAGSLFNIQFQVGSANACSRLFICATPSCPAPVEFLFFNAAKAEHYNHLVWRTASEVDASKFIIERSIDGINFTSIGEVIAKNAINGSEYAYNDYTADFSLVVYYRLKEIDIDGSHQYSEIKTVYNNSGSNSFSVYPIPTKQGQALTVTIYLSGSQTNFMELIDNLGRVINVYNLPNQEGLFSLEIPTTTLTTGLYFIRSGHHFGKVMIE